MQTEQIVERADVKPPESEPAADPAESEAAVPAEKPEAPKPSREDELQRAVAASNMARRRAERDLAEQKLRWETANQRLEELAKRFVQPEAKPPSPEEDPVGAITHETKQTREEVAKLLKEREEEKKASEAQRHQQSFAQAFDRQARAFAEKQPDFIKAQDHVFKGMVEEYEAVGFDREVAEKGAWGNWQAVVNRAFEDGVNPAERIYEWARKRGYRPATTQDKVETIAKGTQATSPLSTGGKSPARLTAEAIAAMNEEDFAKLSDADFKRVFG